ncbi:MFS transporter [Desulfosporosinus fructosivorans]
MSHFSSLISKFERRKQMENSTVYPKFRWFVFLTMIIATIAGAVVMISPSPLVGEVAKGLGVNLGTISAALMAVFTLALGVSAILSGTLVDKLGVTRSYVFGLVVMVIGTILIPFTGNSIGALIVIRVIQGVGQGPITGSISRLAADWFPVQERGLVTGFQGLATSLGVLLGFVIAPTVFASTLSWKAGITWGGFILLLISLVCTLVVAFGPKPPIVSIKTASPKVVFKPFLKMRITWVCILSVVFLCWLFGSFNELTPGYFAVPVPTGLGRGPMVAGQMMMIFQIAFMIGAVLSGFLSENVFGGKEKPLVVLGFTLAAIFCFSIKFSFVYENPIILTICLLIAGISMGMPNPLILGYISKYFPESITGKLGGMALGIGTLISSVGVLIGSMALRSTGTYQLSIVIVSVVAIIGLINALGVKTPKETIGTNNKTIGA